MSKRMIPRQNGGFRGRTGDAVRRAGRRLLASPIPNRILRTRALRDDPVTVLVYHTLGPDQEEMDAWVKLRVGDFARQIAFLKEHYDIVSLDAAIAGERSPTGRPRAVITFDDGDVGLHTYLLPFVERTGIPVTVYVATRQIEEGRPYWFDRIMNAVQTVGPVTLDLSDEGLGHRTLATGRGAANWLDTSALLEALKAVEPARRERVADVIDEQTSGAARRQIVPLAPMSLAQLGAMKANPLITLAAHSHCHSLLDQLPLNEALESVATSRERLRQWTGVGADHFAYPNGNHHERLARGIEDIGFRSATIVGNRLWDGRSDRFMLPRVPIGRYDDFDRFKLRLVGI
jgi:peptidoglycan/xylan/chitin deacetylase (PgdA/CDA1 family)